MQYHVLNRYTTTTNWRLDMSNRYIVRTNDFHGDNYVSGHRKIEIAIKKINKDYRKTDCMCGGCLYIWDTAEKKVFDTAQYYYDNGY